MQTHSETDSLDINDVGIRIRKARCYREVSQKALAEKTHIASNYLSQIEHGQKMPSLELLYRISANLNVTADYLLGSTDCIQSIHTDHYGLPEKMVPLFKRINDCIIAIISEHFRDR